MLSQGCFRGGANIRFTMHAPTTSNLSLAPTDPRFFASPSVASD